MTDTTEAQAEDGQVRPRGKTANLVERGSRRITWFQVPEAVTGRISGPRAPISAKVLYDLHRASQRLSDALLKDLIEHFSSFNLVFI